MADDKGQMIANDLLGDEVEELQVGHIVKGVIVANTNKFSFVKVGKLLCILPLPEMSYDKKPRSPEVGTEIEAVVIRISDEKGVMLSIKRAKQNPWERISDRYYVGQKLTRKVVNITNYGAFVEIEPGIAALLHRKEMGLSKSDKVKDFVSINDELEVEILLIDIESKKMSLRCGELSKKE